MATHLGDLSKSEFLRRLESSGCGPGSRLPLESLHAHYEELRRWAGRVGLVGAGEAATIVERHYAESLRALPFLEGVSRVLDLGSGAGFPGCVLAAARPDIEFWLFESRGRKASFLRAASARAKLSCHVVDARVSRRHPVTEVVPGATIDLVTVRGVRIDRDTWEGLAPGLTAGARILRWEGAAAVEPWPQAKAGRTLELGGRGRKIQEWLYSAEGTW
ncbi:MAG: class I SAM-dependent methyltransferase [Acidobacteria bacterium]|nr:class I SAM-dependent methyltransferase [Acidobacteriota bacterium]